MWEQLKRRNSYQALPTVEPKKDVYRDLHHPVFQSIRILQVSERLLDSCSQMALQTPSNFSRSIAIGIVALRKHKL